MTARLPGGGAAVYKLAVRKGRVIVTEVIVKRPSGVTRTLLRDRSPALAVDRFVQLMKETREWLEGAQDPSLVAQDQRWRRVLEHLGLADTPWETAVDSMMRRRRKPDRILRLALTAALYDQALRNGSRKPNEEVARRQGRKAELVRDDLKRAREAGLLGDAPGRGVPGGQLTAKGERILQEAAK